MKKVKRSRNDADKDIVRFTGQLPKHVEKNELFCEECRWLIGTLREYYVGISAYSITLVESDCDIQMSDGTLKIIAAFRNDKNIATEMFALCDIVARLDFEYKLYLSLTNSLLTIECHRTLENGGQKAVE